MKKKTGYMVKTFFLNKQHGSLCCIDDEGVLWIASSGRKSINRNATVFKSKEEIKAAIKTSNTYAKKHNYRWKDSAYEIVPVTVIF
ncbi:MAG: hypothetical protein JWO92_2524 [Chitinophagaceae bacterium]|nr:hypothetical protein [Chitinophagaceae bacterium]